ncbi:hypothetical protein JTB14_021013 [Gonioctena quinquepunctata]|nr:hypothetical protein JTB14_021013 [Gonioctena quinquepunctata]
MGTELDKERMEKNHILKRMDVLVSANEKMVEMKEIQDSEVLRWMRKYEEIEEKLQQYEWGSDGFSEGTKPKQVETDSSRNQNTEELQQIIKELSLDNEELQALLNEQRQLRVEAEKYKISGRSEEEFVRITSEFEEEMKNLQQEIFNKDKEFHVGIEEKNKFLTELQGELKAKEEIINKFEENVKSLNEINVELKLALEEKLQLPNRLNILNLQTKCSCYKLVMLSLKLYWQKKLELLIN